jgi:glycosyltransferase involved in cell wall biosynthesis
MEPMRILHVIDLLDTDDSARQLQLLCAEGTESLEVCCLGPERPWTQSLRNAGVAVHALQWTRWIDPSVISKLRRILHNTRPDVIHVWRLPALRLLALAAYEWLPRVVLSRPLPAGAELPWWDRWLLRQVRCVDVPPAVMDAESTPACANERAPAKTIVCASPLERPFGVRNAIWAFDIVHYLFPDAQLQIVGAGSQEPSLRSLVTGLQNEAVHFVGAQLDLAPMLQTADVVWVPSVADCGGQVALEAMAQGRAVIASDVPCLRELIDDGETGFLVPPGDVVALGRRTRALFSDDALRERLGGAARQSVRQRFPLAAAVDRWREAYRLAAA